MADNTFRVQGEKLAHALDDHIRRSYSDRSEALQVRRAVADYFRARIVSAREPRRPYPDRPPVDHRPADEPGDWN